MSLQEKLAKLREDTAMETQTLTFALERATKNTIRYTEQTSEDGTPAIGTLYIQKSVLGATPPKTLTVTITEGAHVE